MIQVTATVVKNVKVTVENDGMTEDEALELGIEYAHENFSSECDGTEEKYSEDAVHLSTIKFGD